MCASEGQLRGRETSVPLMEPTHLAWEVGQGQGAAPLPHREGDRTVSRVSEPDA